MKHLSGRRERLDRSRPRRGFGEAALRWLAGLLLCGAAATLIVLAPHARAQESDSAAQIADAEAPAPITGPFSISLADNTAPFASAADGDSAAAQPVELQLSLGREQTGAPVDVAFAHRGIVGPDDARRAHGAEVRVGRGLVASEGNDRGTPSIYAFVSSDDQALTWRPGQRSEFGGPGTSVAIENQVQVGDQAAGIAYEHNGVQAALAYVERRESTRVGRQSFSQDQNFAGVTVTVRH